MKKMIIMLLAALLLLTGCSTKHTDDNKDAVSNSVNSNDSMADKTDSLEIDIAYMDYNEKYELYQQRYPDKIILTWLVDNDVTYEKQLNDYLYENNYDYVICFKKIEAYIAGEGDTFLAVLDDMVNNGVDFDILSSFGICLGADDVSNSYYYLSEMGVFEPLDDYITNEKYSEYYNLLPQAYWDSYKYQGKLYGVDNTYSSLYYNYGVCIGNDVLNESGLEPEAFSGSLTESEEAYKTVYDKTGKRINFYRWFFTEDIFTANYISSGIAVSKGKVINVFELPETKNYFNKLNELAQKGYISIDSGESKVAGNSIGSKNSDGEIMINESLGITKIYNQINNYICNPAVANGVYSKSKNKELAVDALLNVIFNKDINNILTYGLKGEQYDLVDGVVVMNDVQENEESKSIDSRFNNPIVSYPCYQQYNEIIPLDYYKLYEEAEVLDGFGFFFDGRNISDTYKNVILKIKEFKAENEDVDSYIEGFNKQLNDAGLQEVLDEANRQLEAYNEKNN